MVGAVKVTLTPDAIALQPGQSADVDVTIQNAGRSVEHYGTTLVGLPDGAYRIDPPADVKLKPNDSQQVRLKLTVPQRSDLVDGPYVLGVLVRSPHDRAVSHCAELRLQVMPQPGLSMSVQPQAALGGARAGYAVSVTNEGNTALMVTLHASDPEGVVDPAFRPRSLEVPAGGTARAELAVRAPVPWTGQEKRRAITVKAVAGRDLAAEQPVTFTQKPRIAGGLLKLVGMGVAVLVLAAAPIGAAMLTRARQQATQPPPPPAQTTAAAVATTTAPSAGPATPTPAQSKPVPAGSGAVVVPPGQSVTVDFTLLPDGSPVFDRIIPPDFYAAKGVRLASIVDRSPPLCANATGLAVRTLRDRGAFLTSSRLDSVQLCNTLPVRLTLGAAAGTVTVAYIGTGKQMAMTVEFADGTTQRVLGTAVELATDTLTFTAPANHKILSVVVGNTNPDPVAAEKEFTQIKKLTFVAA